jgi:hydrogenase maturation protein HypF
MGTAIEPDRLRQMVRLAGDGTWPLASGAGRIFEAAGALLGVGAVNHYEGEAAARLEALAATAPGTAAPWPGIEIANGASGRVLPSARLLAEVAERIANGENPSAVAAGFHASFCWLATELTIRVSGGRPGMVALGGGCLVNRLLGVGLAEALGRAGYEVLLPRHVPPGDGGLSYGQAVVAAVAAERGLRPRPLTPE